MFCEWHWYTTDITRITQRFLGVEQKCTAYWLTEKRHKNAATFTLERMIRAVIFLLYIHCAGFTPPAD